jgi:hypothetical protein
MSHPETVVSEQEPNAPQRHDPQRWVVASVAIALGLVLPTAWVAFVVWTVAQLV